MGYDSLVRASRWVVLWVCGSITCAASAATLYATKASFLAETRSRIAATFDDVAPGRESPFASGEVVFGGMDTTVQAMLPAPHPAIFPGVASPPNFAWIAFTMQAAFADDVLGIGFDFNCIACDVLPDDSALDWVTLDAAGNVVESGSWITDLRSATTARFFGIATSRPFRSVTILRRSASTAGRSAWAVDDIRLIPDLPVSGSAEPGESIPTLGEGMLLATSALVVAVAGWILRRRARAERTRLARG